MGVMGLAAGGCGREGGERALPDAEPAAGSIQIFGDSIFTSGGGMIEQELERLMARPIDSHAVAGTVMAQIRDQYQSARGDAIRTAIMDGGGNDVLGARGSCQNQFSENCRNIIDNAAAIAKEVFGMMVEDGVANVVHLSVHYPTGWNGGFDQAVDYGYEALARACEESGANCIVVDPRAAFRAQSGLLEWDGIHPNRRGAQTFANLIWENMREAGMEP
jgi:lysophospholipase L1-like esterase